MNNTKGFRVLPNSGFRAQERRLPQDSKERHSEQNSLGPKCCT